MTRQTLVCHLTIKITNDKADDYLLMPGNA